MKKRFKIYRYDPKEDKAPYYKEYELNVKPTDKLLDCLNRIRWEQDASLSFRMSCGHGVCGSDGMKINGTCGLSCQRLIRDYEGDVFTIEPLPNFNVVKDLVVDLEGFFEKYRRVAPYLKTKENPPEKERLQSPKERHAFDEAIRCILCASCTASCPITEENQDYLGPAALLRAFRYLFDSRDDADDERKQALDNQDGAWGCKVHRKCTEVCPKEIPVTQSITYIKMKILGKM
ncbi:succinate dehydrogenase/fumarate reductase iron-sulfur subunit [Acidobacteriota bacterium]